MIKKSLVYALVLLIMCYLGYICVGAIKRKPSVIVKEDAEYTYVRRYSLYNKDSCVYKYHKPIIYKGVVTHQSTGFVGVVGKGGRHVYCTYIKYNNNQDHCEIGYNYYATHKRGDTIVIKVSYYPYETITLLN